MSTISLAPIEALCQEIPKSTSKIAFAQILRGYAALLVCINHLFLVYWNSQAVVGEFIKEPLFQFGQADPNFLHQFATLLFDYTKFSPGYFGVSLFFLISGFVIPFSLEKRNGIGFMLNRILRILPTLVVALAIDSFILSLCSLWSASSTYQFNLQQFIINCALLRPFFGGTFIDPVTWSLEIELLFYLLMASWFYFVPLKKQYSLLVIAFSLTTFSLLFSHANQPLLLFLKSATFYLVFMLLGCQFYKLLKHYANLKTMLWQSVLMFICLFLQFTLSFPEANFALALNYLLAYGVFTVTFLNNNQLKETKFSAFFSNISYSLYISHQIVGYIIISYLISFFQCPAWVACTTAFLTTIALSTLVNKWVEQPSIKWSKLF